MTGGVKKIPDSDSTHAVANILDGFPAVFSSLRKNGGKSVSRKDMNAILYMLSTLNYYFQAMGRNPWRSGMAYPAGAKVWHKASNSEYVSKYNDNGYEPTNATYWTKLNDIYGNTSASVDMSAYYTKAEVDELISYLQS